MKTLVEIMNASETSEAAFLYMSMRQRLRTEPMRVARFGKAVKEAGCKVVRDDLYQMFKDLESIGAGKLTISRTVPFLFTWSENYKDLANKAIAAAGLNKVQPIAAMRPKARPLTTRVRPSQHGVQKTQDVVFVMSNGALVRLHLVKQIQDKDLATLATNLQNLIA